MISCRHLTRRFGDSHLRLLPLHEDNVVRGQRLPGSVVEQLDEILAQGTTEAARVLQHSQAIGRTLGELDLDPSGTHARAVAVVRGGRAVTTLDASFRIEGGDTLVLLGAHREIDAALERLAPPSTPAATRGVRGWPGEDPSE